MSRNTFIPYDPALRAVARRLRRNSTLAEILLWQQIKGRKLGVQFHRQVPLDEFIVDFYCHELLLAIEIDGATHDNPENYASDIERQKRLESFGVQFIRVEDHEVKINMDGVMKYLSAEVRKLIKGQK